MKPADARAPRATDPLDHVEVWIFDLDNTLYPASCDLFAQVHRRIGEFIARQLAVDLDTARQVQHKFFLEHGTTLRGLMTEHGVEPSAFLDFVHDIDVSPVPPDPSLRASLERLEGRKLIFTNGSVAHAERVIGRLGVAGQFEAIVDIAASEYLPKPDRRAYDRMIASHRFDPRQAAMVEDMAVNLRPAHALGMTTVWVRTAHDWAGPKEGEDHVDHRIDDLSDWLAEVVAARGAAGRAAG
ncbi:MAG: pyrimidine 5'-nucleotidase [Inquilinus sp.]|nr:pyrimidine 5'-nucleotidase [Inquilinus sp.]